MIIKMIINVAKNLIAKNLIFFNILIKISFIASIIIIAGNLSHAFGPGCVTRAEAVYNPWSNGPIQVPLCEKPLSIPIPTKGRIIDLSEHNTQNSGSCQTFFQSNQVIEIDPALGFPIFIRLPKVNKQDPACKKYCDLGETDSDRYEKTFYGITFKFKDEFHPILHNSNLVFRVQSPWFFVTGNEGESTLCMDGRPSVLEYGKPLNCSNTHVTRFGFATKSLSSEEVTAVIDLVPLSKLPGNCCPYMCNN